MIRKSIARRVFICKNCRLFAQRGAIPRICMECGDMGWLLSFNGRLYQVKDVGSDLSYRKTEKPL